MAKSPARLPAKPNFERRIDLRSFGEPLTALRAIPIQDHGEPLVDVREFCPHLLCLPGCLPFLRETVARQLGQAAEALPPGHVMTVGTALRTPAMQRDLRERFTQDLREKHPEWSKATLNRMLNRMIAPVDDPSPAPHTTGGAVDVGVRGPDGQDLDFVSPVEHWEAAPTYCHRLSETARANRLMLIAAMEAAGLTNYVGEWWHWSWGDQGWALRTGSPVAYYGPVELENAESLRIPKSDDARPE